MNLKLVKVIGLSMGIVLMNAPWAAPSELPDYLNDRGTGVALSMFGTYINGGEFIFYPFFEYYKDKNAEYSPEELGFGLDQDFRGRFTGTEYLLFFGYGITDNVAVEFESAVYSTAELLKAADDPTALPDKLTESGLGDVEGQLRWRYNRETRSRPEYFSYFETVFPLQKDKVLIGTQDWEFKFGSGLTKGFSWGTLTARLAVEYDAGEKVFELGEYALEYLHRLSKKFRFAVIVEGSEDEVEFITDLQFHLSPKTFIRINNAFGATSKATDYAPEIGIVFRY